ncbi:MAG: ATP-binding protein [Cyclobacteriaceae bacterium]
MARLVVLFLLNIFCAHAFAQEYHIKRYRVEDGLPSDIIKGCAQDSLGFFWVATDDGLVKYDGIKFTTYREPLHSSFIKGFFRTKSGRLFAFGDLDFLEIKNYGDTTVFKMVCPVSRNANDTSLTYPKSIYEDRLGNLWASESQSVVRIKNNKLKRFSFDLSNRSPQFLRSFQFFEDLKGNLFISSFQGNVFKYNPELDQFESLKEKMPFQVEHISVFENQLLIGALDGFSTAPLLENGGFGKVELKFKYPFISHIVKLPDGSHFLATRGARHFIADLEKNTFTPISELVNNINHVYVSHENDIWLSSNDGLILMKENLTYRASITSEFIEAITEDVSTGDIFYANSNSLFRFDPTKRINQELLTIPDGYYQSLASTHEGVWAANAFTVFLYRDGEIKKKFDLSKTGLFITDLISDSNENIWLTHPGSYYVNTIKNNKLLSINVPVEKEGATNLVREGKDGLYIASTGKKTYLYFKSFTDSSFRNISAPIKFETHGDFNVTDLAFTNDIVWMATSEGLLKYTKNKIERIDLGPTFTGLPAKCVEVYGDKLLFANAYGLIMYDPSTGEQDLFNESNGLPSNTITPRGLFVDRKQRVWIGTSKGLCYTTKPLIQQQKTPRPHFIETKINGKRIRMTSSGIIPYGSFISIGVSSITFPEKEVVIQYRLSLESPWKIISGSEINLSEIDAGSYTLEVRAKKNGPFSWSESNTIHFLVGKPFWRRSWFILLCFFIAAILVFATGLWVNYRNRAVNRQLEKLIEERTTALRLTNEELSQRNSELDRFVYSASHDLSAPLRSILGLIHISKLEKPSATQENYLELMRASVIKLDSFIKDIISYSRNTRLGVKSEPVAFKPLIESIWADLQFTPSVDKIVFEIQDELTTELRSDETRLKIIFNNLLSNAIKFHRIDQDHKPFIRVSAKESNNHFEFCVEDNGIGIPADQKEKIFDMFFRATETAQGSGLGLYILKEAVVKLRGTVRVQSEINEGSTFSISLPK